MTGGRVCQPQARDVTAALIDAMPWPAAVVRCQSERFTWHLVNTPWRERCRASGLTMECFGDDEVVTASPERVLGENACLQLRRLAAATGAAATARVASLAPDVMPQAAEITWLVNLDAASWLLITVPEQSTAESDKTSDLIETLVLRAGGWLWQTDADHRLVDLRFEEHNTSLRRAALLGKTRWALAGDADAATPFWQAHKAVLDRHEPFVDFVFTLAANHGGERVLSVSGMPQVDSAGRFLGYHGISRDITERERLRAELVRREARLQAIFDNAADAIVLADETGAIQGFNAAAETLFGYTTDEVLGKELGCLLPADARVRHSGYLKACRQGAMPNVLGRARRLRAQAKDGSAIVIELALGRYRDGEKTCFAAMIRDVRARVEAEQRLEDQNRLLADAGDMGRLGYWRLDLDTRQLTWSDQVCQIHGLDPRGPQPSFDHARAMLVGEDRARLRDAMEAAIATREPFDLECALRRADGELRHVVMRGRPRVTDTGGVDAIFGIMIDISERKQQELRLKRDARRLSFALEGAREGLYDYDLHSGDVYFSPRAEALLGYEPGTLRPHLSSWVRRMHKDDRRATAAAVRDHLKGSCESLTCEFRVRRRDGQWIWVELRGRVAERMPDNRPRRLVGTLSDISQRKEAEARMAHLALHDTLTGLPNRKHFLQSLENERARAARSGSHLAVMFLDLDNFKDVNDTLGHEAGDHLLIETARRLRDKVRKGDLVARLGGDEFAILINDLMDDHATERLAERIVDALSRPFTYGNALIRSGTSIGITVYPNDPGSAEQLLANADLALYAAKSAGRGGWRLFDGELQADVSSRAEIEHDLARALANDELALHFQPFIDLNTLGFAGVEALLRWRHPSRGLITPAGFLQVAENSRLIFDLTRWAIGHGLACYQRWAAQGLICPKLSLNFAPRTLGDPALAALVDDMLREHEVSAETIAIEVPEGAFARERRLLPTLEALRDLGVDVTVDDFGSGSVSLARLRSLPISCIKMDRLLTANLATDPINQALVTGISGLANALDIAVVGEGIERRADLDALRDLGCTRAQGYLIARPMPPDRLLPWLADWRRNQGAMNMNSVKPATQDHRAPAHPKLASVLRAHGDPMPGSNQPQQQH